MRIIPVLDLLGGQVVQGIQGARHAYRPVNSVLTSSTHPVAVAHALQKETDCTAFYVADLDAIEGAGHHRREIAELSAQVEADFWVDAGVADPAAVRPLLEAGAGRVIIGSETLVSLKGLDAIVAAHSRDHLLVSVDVKNGRLLAGGPELAKLKPLDLVAHLATAGWRDAVLLTLDRVGTGVGPDRDLLEAARRAAPSLAFVAGGGVHTVEDLRSLAAGGAAGVLLASALHRNWIRKNDLAEFTIAATEPESSQDHPPRSET